MDKRSSARAARIAARVLDGAPCTAAQAKTLAASVLAQRAAPVVREKLSDQPPEFVFRVSSADVHRLVREICRHELRRAGFRGKV